MHLPLDYATLRVIWWGLMGVLLIGFALTDGWDLGVAALLSVIELLADRASKLVDDLPCVDEVEGTYSLADELRCLFEELDVALDLARGVRSLHLDGDTPAVW